MPLPIPNLDDRTFEKLIEEIKRLIVAHTPEWTDRNENDPGTTLIQMFAGLTEIILYRQNKIMTAHEKKIKNLEAKFKKLELDFKNLKLSLSHTRRSFERTCNKKSAKKTKRN